MVSLLEAIDANPERISAITIWTNKNTAQLLPARKWLKVITPRWAEAGILWRTIGQQVFLPRAIRMAKCEVLFSPGGTLPMCVTVPTVTMSQNMLPFESRESALFGRLSGMNMKMRLLRYTQGRSFKRAQGVIFLTQYAKLAVTSALHGMRASVALIPHGIDRRFMRKPQEQRAFSEFSMEKPFHLLYVSILMPYKHQVEVAEAIAQLRNAGLPIELQFVGAPWGRYGDLFQQTLKRLDPKSTFLKWVGHVNFNELHEIYNGAEGFVFASSCENLPNIMIEAMAAGLPIASSNRGPMPEVLGDAGHYFDPEYPESIAATISAMAKDVDLRARLAQAAWHKAQTYSWNECANETFKFISQVAGKSGGMKYVQ